MSNRVSRLTSVAVLFGLAIAWQIASLLVRAESVPGEPMVPGWQVLFTQTFLTLSDYWLGGFGVAGIAQGGARTARHRSAARSPADAGCSCAR